MKNWVVIFFNNHWEIKSRQDDADVDAILMYNRQRRDGGDAFFFFIRFTPLPKWDEFQYSMCSLDSSIYKWM